MKKPSRSGNDRSTKPGTGTPGTGTPSRGTPGSGGRLRLRVIGGTHRSRQLQFVDAPGLRPTPDRVRETLFNWLTPLLPGARCLDAFAGSGALGIEALSRGAGEVDFFEANAAAAAAIAANLATLQCKGTTLTHGDAIALLQSLPAKRYDIVFCDPPFHTTLLNDALAWLTTHTWLGDTGLIYVEAARDDVVVVPASWHWHRHQYAGQVQYGLLRRD